MKVAFIGLGLMGEPMAGHIMRAGHQVFVVTHRNRVPIDRLVQAGAVEVETIAAAAAASDVALMVLPTSKEVEAVLFGDTGIAAGMKPGYLAVDMGTCYPTDTKRLARRFAEAGGRFIDAPVTGGVEGARAATLAIMAGGMSRRSIRSGRFCRLSVATSTISATSAPAMPPSSSRT